MADLSDEAVEAAATAFASAQYGDAAWNEILMGSTRESLRVKARAVLAAALPALNTAKGSETREAIAAELDRRAEEFVDQARVFGNPHDSTPAAGAVATLLDLAREFRADAASLRGEQGE